MVAPPDNDVLRAHGLHHAHGSTTALTEVSLGVREGQILAVVGPRGSGKTTLLRCLSGQLVPHKGEVWFNDTSVHTLSRRNRERLRLDHFGWIDTEPRLVPELNAWENAALPLLLRGIPRRDAKQSAGEWLERLDVSQCARRRPAQLDQSERQRVALARALATAPKVLFADDPAAPLHRAEGAQVLRTLTTAARSHHITVVLAAADPATSSLADHTVTLLDGRRIEATPEENSEDGAGDNSGGTARDDSGDGPGDSSVDGPGDGSDDGSGGGSDDGPSDGPGGGSSEGPSNGPGDGPGDGAGDEESRAACSLSA
ncbi:ATP-binding cassette domain-containing protein [Streptomyces sp. MST-110588]|nr:ATP-binding cassette domain-containing protein [Streptomyces sp. MST-110588]